SACRRHPDGGFNALHHAVRRNGKSFEFLEEYRRNEINDGHIQGRAGYLYPGVEEAALGSASYLLSTVPCQCCGWVVGPSGQSPFQSLQNTLISILAK